MKLRSYLNKHVRHAFMALVLVAFLPGCIVVVEKDDHEDDDYYRRRWRLDVVVYSSGIFTPNDGGVYTVSFNNESTFSGRADCVDFEGRYEVGRSSTLNINTLDSEEGACGTDSISSMYLEELANARSFSGNADELVIHLEGSDNLMRFKPD